MTHKPTAAPWTALPMLTKTGLPFAPVFATTLIAQVYSTAFGDYDQCIANAHLMAAAPELLAALTMAIKQNNCDMLLTGEELRRCMAAIDKATHGSFS